MQLTVLSIAYPFAPVREGAVGGAEEILAALDQAIVETGNRSIVVAQEGSRVKGVLYSTAVPSGQLFDQVRDWVRRLHQGNVERALQAYDVDVIHLHGIDFTSYTLPKHIPILATLHLPPSWYPSDVWSSAFSHIQMQCVSQSQRNACPNIFANLPVIENGVAIEAQRRHAKHGYALVLGRICPEKNIHTALDASMQAGIPALLGGQVFPYPEHLQYFREEIEPRLRNRNRFLGPLSPSRKRRLLKGARCLLVPTRAPETSSLVAMEALAAGTPVIAFPSGALVEIIEDGVTGFLVNTAAEMAEAIQCASFISPEMCRKAAMRRFSRQRMIDEYLSLYKQMLLTRLATGDLHHAAV